MPLPDPTKPSRTKPADALVARALALAKEGQKEQAVALFRQALRLQPSHAPIHHNLGVALAELGRLGEAVQSFTEALRLRPDYFEALCNLASALHQLKRLDEAIAAFRRAWRLKPDHAETLSNLGLTLFYHRQAAEAVVLLKQAVRLRPDFAEAYNNLGLAQCDLGDLREGAECFEQALRLAPHHIKAHTNLGNTYKDQGRLAEALACYELAQALDPAAVSPRWNRALTLLNLGDYQRGWPEYESRLLKPDSGVRSYAEPRWDGSPLAGRTLLLHTEQGMGDMIQFVRFAALAKEGGGRVILACPAKIGRLFSSCTGLDQVVDERGPLPTFDVQAPLMSVPALLGTTLATVPARVPYLSAEPERVERWREKLSEVRGFRVGVVWQGNPQNRQDRWRSFPLALLEPLARVEGVRLISLQRGFGTEQLAQARLPILELNEGMEEDLGCFLETAAVIQNLDLVVSTDTAVAHLAGALGKRAWVALPRVCDWRWLVGREDSPWYPTLRLFRQQEPGSWEPVFAAMSVELRRQVAGRPGVRRISVAISPGELLDRIAVMQIKAERLPDPQQREIIRHELQSLEEAREQHLPGWENHQALMGALREVHTALWEAQEELRACVEEEDYGDRYVKLACSIPPLNEKREQLQRKLREQLEDTSGPPAL